MPKSKLETLFELYSSNFDLKTVHVPLKDVTDVENKKYKSLPNHVVVL